MEKDKEKEKEGRRKIRGGGGGGRRRRRRRQEGTEGVSQLVPIVGDRCKEVGRFPDKAELLSPLEVNGDLWDRRLFAESNHSTLNQLRVYLRDNRS